jgi:hypothetical protein
MAKIHYVPLVLCGLAVAEGMFIVYNPSLALAALLTFVAVPLVFFGLKTKRLFKAFSYGALFFITIFSWTAGFIRGLMDRNIW